ncbi:YeiH family protein [Phenylobacterium sp.]|uniref:YeiH family protein n=1 Tax=Phenylobacterium sp. TaxID=1871053 RepID=UPI0035B0EF8D
MTRHLSPAALRALLPGVILCAAVTAAAFALQGLEVKLFGRPWLEALVLAILLGAAVRSVWSPGERWSKGVQFCGKTLLEVAVLLLGASLSAEALLAVGAPLLVGVVGAVAVSLAAGYGLGRLLGLPHRMATLVACGNSICGNSAIAAVAPVIGAEAEEVAASIGFTAVLGVLVVLILPPAAAALHMTPRASGVLAGLTVYAVPQVLAATAPIGALAAQVGTVVKLSRVLMLGPVVFGLSLLSRGAVAGEAEQAKGGKPRLQLGRLAPWFILGFIALAAARSFGLIPHAAIAPASHAATWLTVISMAALGLGVDVRAVSQAGGRVTAVVTLSLIALAGVALLLIWGLGLA